VIGAAAFLLYTVVRLHFALFVYKKSASNLTQPNRQWYKIAFTIKMARELLMIENNVTLVVTSHISDDKYAYPRWWNINAL
jgi:hypothetical protein